MMKRVAIGVMNVMAMLLSMTSVASTAPSPHSNAPYSNIIVFGDSQSDIGNGPESLTVDDSANPSPPPDGIFTNLYVPISNPVDTTTDDIIPSLTGTLSFPSFDGASQVPSVTFTLPPQLDVCRDGICVKRSYHSINWVEYLVSNAVDQGLMAPGADLRPWVIQHQEANVNLQQSVDYAWYSALSRHQCADFAHQPVSCTLHDRSMTDSILASEENYRNHQSQTDSAYNLSLRDQLIIPAVQRQVELFEQDVKRGTVTVDPNTLYIVRTGANDLDEAYINYISQPAVFWEDVTQAIPDAIDAPHNPRSTVSRLVAAGAKHVLVLGEYNLGLTPGQLDAFTTPLSQHAAVRLFNRICTRYNATLQANIASEPSWQGIVTYVDIQTPINQLQKRAGFASTLGERCESNGDTDQKVDQLSKGQAIACYNADGMSTGWWNTFHASTQVHQVVAKAVLDAMQASVQ